MQVFQPPKARKDDLAAAAPLPASATCGLRNALRALMRGWRVLPGVLAAIGMLFVAGCGEVSEEENMRRLQTEVVMVDLKGEWFDIPMRYFYMEAVGKWGASHWPRAKKGRTHVDNISLTLLLPDLRPYDPADHERWVELGHGDRLNVTMSRDDNAAVWFQGYRGNVLGERKQRRNLTRLSDVHGLMRFRTPRDSHVYLPLDATELNLTCSRDSLPSPSCSVKSNHRAGLVLEYYYSARYLPHWREIDRDLKRLLDGFSAQP